MAAEEEESRLRAALSKRDPSQEHLLGHWERLDEAGRAALAKDIDSVDFEEMEDTFRRAMTGSDDGSSVSDRMEVLEPSLCASYLSATPEETSAYTRASLRAVARGEVGVLLLAGGQGTRLGVPYPKGMYDIGLPSGKTLYQIQMERVKRLQNMAKEQEGKGQGLKGIAVEFDILEHCFLQKNFVEGLEVNVSLNLFLEGRITVYVMTSEHTKAPTAEFLSARSHFGLDPDDVVLFEQRMIPCFDLDGKMILETPSKLARAPDGNGGLYWALDHEGVLDHMDARGVK